jgi:hypothetical protein
MRESSSSPPPDVGSRSSGFRTLSARLGPLTLAAVVLTMLALPWSLPQASAAGTDCYWSVVKPGPPCTTGGLAGNAVAHNVQYRIHSADTCIVNASSGTQKKVWFKDSVTGGLFYGKEGNTLGLCTFVTPVNDTRPFIGYCWNETASPVNVACYQDFN